MLKRQKHYLVLGTVGQKILSNELHPKSKKKRKGVLVRIKNLFNRN